MRVDIRHERELSRFVATARGRDSYLRYTAVGDDKLDLVSTFVHRDLRGRGIGERLVKAALDHAREQGMSVIPSCWFVETVIDRNPLYRDLLVG